jgi:hypothetical protein
MEQLRPFGSLFAFLEHPLVVGWICWVGMPARLIRYQEAGDNHFITFSCYRRTAYFSSIASRNLFEALMSEAPNPRRPAKGGYSPRPETLALLKVGMRRVKLWRSVSTEQIY